MLLSILLLISQGQQVDDLYCGKTADDFPPPVEVCEDPTAAQLACLYACHQEYVDKMLATYEIACQRYYNAYDAYKDKQQEIFDTYDSCKAAATTPEQALACRQEFISDFFDASQAWKAFEEYVYNFTKNASDHAKSEYVDCASQCCNEEFTYVAASSESRPLPDCGQLPTSFDLPEFECPEGYSLDPVCAAEANDIYQEAMEAAYDAYCEHKADNKIEFEDCAGVALDGYDACMAAAITPTDKFLCRIEALGDLISCVALHDWETASNEIEFQNDVADATDAYLAAIAQCCETE